MDKTTAKQILRQKLIEQRPEMATVFAMQDLKEAMDNGSKSTLESMKIENMLEKLKTKGEDGYTPIKGTDYFTKEDINLLKQGIKEFVTPIKGKDYFTEQEITEFANAVTPIKGIHYFDGKDSTVPGPQGKPGVNGEPGNDGSQDTPKEIADKINTLDKEISYKVLKDIPTRVDISVDNVIKELKKKQYLEPKDIKGMPIDMRWHGGWSKNQTDPLYYPLDTNPNQYIIGDGIAKITVGLSAPTSPNVGDFWCDTN